MASEILEMVICRFRYMYFSDNMGNVLWSILNIFILIIIGWPVAFLCCGAYITISPFAACFGSGCDAITDVLQKGVQWPRGLGAAIANGDSSMGC